MAVNGTERYLQTLNKMRFPLSGRVDPTHNDSDNSSVDGNYPYNSSNQRAQEPVTTDSSGHQSSQPVSPSKYSHPGGGVLRLQAALANRAYARNGNNPAQGSGQTTSVNYYEMPTPQSNENNLNIAKDKLNMEDVNYKEMAEYVQKLENEDFQRKSAYAGISSLGAALGGTSGKWSTKLGSYG